MKCFQKQPHICLKTKISTALSEAVAYYYPSEAAARSLKNIKYSQKQPHNLQHKKYVLHNFFHGLLHKIYIPCVEDFHNLSMIMKTSLMEV